MKSKRQPLSPRRSGILWERKSRSSFLSLGLPGGGALTTDANLDFAGKFGIRSKGLTGWDPTEEEITGYSFTNRGGCWKQTWSKVDGNLVEEYEGVNLDGVTHTGRRIFILKGKDQLTIRSVNTMREGKSLPDTESTYERRKLP